MDVFIKDPSNKRQRINVSRLHNYSEIILIIRNYKVHTSLSSRWVALENMEFVWQSIFKLNLVTFIFFYKQSKVYNILLKLILSEENLYQLGLNTKFKTCLSLSSRLLIQYSNRLNKFEVNTSLINLQILQCRTT